MRMNRKVLEQSLQHSCKMYFGVSQSGSGTEGRVYPDLSSPSVPGERTTGGSGCGGLSVLEESHVVSESGQLLLIWNQWDGGRICWERGGEAESEGDSWCCQVPSIFLHLPGSNSVATAHVCSVRQTQQVTGFKLTADCTHLSSLQHRTCLTTLPTESSHVSVRHSAWRALHFTFIPTRLISCARATLQPTLPSTVMSQWCCGGGADMWGLMVSGLACCTGHVRSRCFSSYVRWLQRAGHTTTSGLAVCINQEFSLTNVYIPGLFVWGCDKNIEHRRRNERELMRER